jgi:predicted DNA-binding protein
MAMITIRLPQELRDRIDKLSERTGHTKTHFMLRLLERGVRNLEEELDELEEIRAAIRAGRKSDKTYSMEEVLADVGLTWMDIGMDSEGKKATKATAKVSRAKNPKKAKVAKPEPQPSKSSKTTKRK